MTLKQVKRLSENLVIKVNENPNQGVCSITENFKEGFNTGIEFIDNIEVEFNNNAKFDGIGVYTKNTKETVLYVEGQKALLLNIVAEGLIDYLGIEITK